MELRIVEKPGSYTVPEMRTVFENAIRSTKAFRDNTPLGTMTVNGEFSHYTDPDTDTMWLGFAIGMRAAQRIEKARAGA